PNDNIAISAHGSGNILVQTLNPLREIDVLGNVISGSGHISLRAGLLVDIGEVGGSVHATVQTGGSGTIDIEAIWESIAMSSGSRVIATNGDIRLYARSHLILGGISTFANVSLTSLEASILDGGSSVANVQASGLRMVAAERVGRLVPETPGDAPAPIRTTVSTISARVLEGNINVLKTGSISADEVGATVNRVGIVADTTVGADSTQSDLRTMGGNGSVVLQTTAGNIVLNDGSVLADGTLGTDNTAVS